MINEKRSSKGGSRWHGIAMIKPAWRRRCDEANDRIWRQSWKVGPLDELVASHEELGIFAILDELEVQRTRTGIPDDLLLRTLATLPFVEQASLSGGSSV